METNEYNVSFSDSSAAEDQFSLPRSVQFSLIFIVNIPSTICTLLLLYHFLIKYKLRIAIHNHMIILLLFTILIVQLIDMSLYLKYLHLGYVSPQTTAMCFIWWYVDITFYDTIVILLAWTSLERHILIFHSKLVSTTIKLWIFHYIPMILFLIYPLSFYLFVLLIPTCEDKYLFDFQAGWCNYQPCYYNDEFLSLYDTLMNAAIPCLLIALFSIILVLRILWTKYIRFHRPIEWKKYRKMTIQLVLIALFFLLFNLPLLIYDLMDTCGSLPIDINDQIFPYFFFAANFSVLLLPFVISFSLPKKIWSKQWETIKQIVRQGQNRIYTS